MMEPKSWITCGETYYNRAERKNWLEKVCIFIVILSSVVLFVL